MFRNKRAWMSLVGALLMGFAGPGCAPEDEPPASASRSAADLVSTLFPLAGVVRYTFVAEGGSYNLTLRQDGDAQIEGTIEPVQGDKAAARVFYLPGDIVRWSRRAPWKGPWPDGGGQSRSTTRRAWRDDSDGSLNYSQVEHHSEPSVEVTAAFSVKLIPSREAGQENGLDSIALGFDQKDSAPVFTAKLTKVFQATRADMPGKWRNETGHFAFAINGTYQGTAGDAALAGRYDVKYGRFHPFDDGPRIPGVEAPYIAVQVALHPNGAKEQYYLGLLNHTALKLFELTGPPIEPKQLRAELKAAFVSKELLDKIWAIKVARELPVLTRVVD
jgi:hypothetical protein